MFAGKPGRHAAGAPLWWRSTFEASPAAGPMFFEPSGLTKGQFFVNGRHVGRYFATTPGGRRVGPQSRYLIPGSWLKSGENELTIFDEHGAAPGRVKLTY
jgi:beta-galactosidase